MRGGLALTPGAADAAEPELGAADADDRPAYRAGFVLLVLVTAALFLRPSELVPALRDVPVYEALVVGCLAASVPAVLGQLRPAALAAHPASLCVVALLPCVVLSSLTHGDAGRARAGGAEFAKVVLYYLLVVGVVTTPARFRRFVLAVAGLILVAAALALLNHHGVIDVGALDAMEQPEGYDEWTGERLTTVRLQASGLFNDPNDFALVLVVAVLVCARLAAAAPGWAARAACLAALATCLYAVALTRSRGGFLALLAGGTAFAVSRLGWRRALPACAVLAPVLVAAFGGRQTNISLGDEDDTGYARVKIWSEALGVLKGNPVFGAGYGMMARDMGIVAHNSFVHSYTELGLIGGTFFLGAFHLPIAYLRRQRDEVADPADGRDVLGWRPCLLAVLVAYAVGLCALSRGYAVTTYVVLGIAGAYYALTAAATPAAAHGEVPAVLARLARTSACAVVALYVFVKIVV